MAQVQEARRRNARYISSEPMSADPRLLADALLSAKDLVTHLQAYAEAVVIQPSAWQSVLSQCAVLGDPVKGQRRGVRAEGNGQTISQCHVGEIWRVGMETQAVGASNGCRDLLIDDSTLEGASQALM